MKNLVNSYVLCLITSLIFLTSCRHEVIFPTIISDEKSEIVSDTTKNGLQTRATCTIPSDFLSLYGTGVSYDPLRPTSDYLYKTRLAVAVYRYWLRGFRSGKNPILKSDLATYDIAELGVSTSELNALNTAISTVRGTTNSDTKFNAILNFVKYIVQKRVSISMFPNDLMSKSTSWSNGNPIALPFGSYSIIFETGYVYAGKGYKKRCEESALERCNANASDQPKWGDWEGNDYKMATYNVNISSLGKESAQADKEEAIRIEAITLPSYKYYNVNSAPGVTRIKQDGF
jgi:hypothetical protein